MSGRSAVLPLLLAALILPVQGVALSDSGGDVKSHVSARAVTDFEVTTIEFSSASSSLPIWQQPDGELAEYIVRDETLTITVRITQLGIGAQGQYAVGLPAVGLEPAGGSGGGGSGGGGGARLQLLGEGVDDARRRLEVLLGLAVVAEEDVPG